jgi:hypothetical protein
MRAAPGKPARHRTSEFCELIARRWLGWLRFALGTSARPARSFVAQATVRFEARLASSSDIRVGSFATGTREQRGWPCPPCPESGSKIGTWASDWGPVALAACVQDRKPKQQTPSLVGPNGNQSGILPVHGAGRYNWCWSLGRNADAEGLP